MRPYGSKRSFDTEPRIKSARALEKRETLASVKEALLAEGPLVSQCHTCGDPAVWIYMPGGPDYCDRCVPRGCSCWADEDGGEKLPCIEYREVLYQ